jgi:translocation and assembly module TamB
LITIAAAALIVGGAFTLLRTSWGSDVARRIGLHFANQQLAGRLDVKRLRFGGDHLHLEDVVLRDPRGGAVVARVERLDVSFRPFALLRGHVDLSRADIVGPELNLVLDDGGSNLGRAVASRAPSPPEESGPSGFRLSVAQLDLRGGIFDMRQPGAPIPHLRASKVGARIAGRLAVATWKFQGQVAVDARVEAPVAVPLSVAANAKGDGDRREGAVSLTLGGAALEATASTRRDAATGALAASAHVRRLHVPHELVRAVLPDVPLAAPVDAVVNAALVGAALRADARVTAGGGAIALRGAADFSRSVLRELTVEGHDVDLGRVVAGLPRSSLAFELRAHGAGRTLRTATGEASFSSPGGHLGGYALGPVRVRLKAARGGVELSELQAVLPGTTVTARGWARRGAVDLRAALEAADLGKTARSLGLASVGIAGRGRLEARATGSIQDPAIAVKGRFPALTVKGTAMREIALNASLTGPRLNVDARMAAPQPLTLHAGGRVALARGVDLRLEALDLAYPEARWRLVAPARIVVRSDFASIDGLDLRADGQSIRAQVRAPRAAPLDAHLTVSALDLGRLPRLAQPPGRELGGRLDVEARITGTRRRPAVEARVSLANGRVGATRDLALSLDLSFARARLSGAFKARGLSTSARGRFDVPAAWPVRASREPVEIDVELAPTDLAATTKELRLPGPRLGGEVELSLRVTGTASEPQANLEVRTRALAVAGFVLGDPRLSFSASRGAPTRLQIDVPPGAAKAAGAPTLAGTLSFETPASLGRLLHGSRSLEDVLATTLSASGALGGVPLAPLARALGVEARVRGTASLRLSVTGTPRAPTGALNVMVHGAASDAFPPTDGRLDLALGERDIRVAARAWRQAQSRPLAAMSATWGTTLARILSGPAAFRAAAAEAPLDLRLFAGPGEVKHKTYMSFETFETGGTADYLRARTRVTATITGTLSRPVVDANAEISEAHLGNQNAGRAQVHVHYADAQAKVTATAASAGGGTLRLQAATRADLGYPQGLAALNPEQLPVEATVEARAFDVAWLSGLTDALRLVSGKLDANARVDGTLGAPAFAGRLEWKNGAVTISEIGEYHDVHVALHADHGTVTLDDLSAASRGGKARVTGHAGRASDGGLDVTARAELKRFPLYAQGDVLGTLSTRLALRANASRAGAKAHVDVEEAKVELGEIRRKDVQSLDRPANVVLVAGGRPIDKSEARKLKVLEQERRARGAPAQGAGLAADEAAAAPWKADVEIVAPNQLRITGEEADVELGLGAGFKVVADPQLRIVGAVFVRKGTVNVLGRKFTLQKDSTVRFHGPPESPALDVVAQHVNERSKVAVLVTLRGTPDDLKIDVSSPDRPDLTQAQLYSLIVTGQLDVGEQRSVTGSSSFSSEAATLVGGLLASSLQKTLRKKLPLDVLTIQAGTGLTGSRLEAGTYLGDRLYVGYVGRVGSDPILLQNHNAVRVEYQFTPRWSLDAEYGDVGTGTADVVWNKHY